VFLGQASLKTRESITLASSRIPRATALPTYSAVKQCKLDFEIESNFSVVEKIDHDKDPSVEVEHFRLKGQRQISLEQGGSH